MSTKIFTVSGNQTGETPLEHVQGRIRLEYVRKMDKANAVRCKNCAWNKENKQFRKALRAIQSARIKFGENSMDVLIETDAAIKLLEGKP